MLLPNKALHRTSIPLHSIAADELGRYASKMGSLCMSYEMHMSSDRLLVFPELHTT
ncbi:MAG: hypothetical protein AB4426_18930 [Xenococcaceae cyanobacterium]